MKKQRLTPEKMKDFEMYLRNEEKSSVTIEKYMRDVRYFFGFVGAREICKQSVMEYKKHLGESYAVSSANSMIAALNSFLRFCGCHEMCVKQFKMQREVWCSEEKELTRDEYIRLLDAASKKNNARLHLILQTICGTGIRVSELRYITVEALQKGEAVVSSKGKNRRVFIVPQLKKKLLEYVKSRDIKTGAIFITRRGNPIGRNNVWREMKSLCEGARVLPSKVFPHNLRHLFARTFYHIEKDIVKLADILGHASINTTRVYTVTTGWEHKRKMEHMRLII